MVDNAIPSAGVAVDDAADDDDDDGLLEGSLSGSANITERFTGLVVDGAASVVDDDEASEEAVIVAVDAGVLLSANDGRRNDGCAGVGK